MAPLMATPRTPESGPEVSTVDGAGGAPGGNQGGDPREGHREFDPGTPGTHQGTIGPLVAAS